MILSVDPGLAKLGTAIIDPINEKVLLTHYIKTSSKNTTTQRISQIISEISSYITTYNINQICIEELYSHPDRKYLLRTYRVIGAIQLLAIQKNIAVQEINPSHMKKIITGNGRADKKEILESITDILPDSQYNQLIDAENHEIDAIGIGITYIRDFVNPDFMKKKEKKKMTLFA